MDMEEPITLTFKLEETEELDVEIENAREHLCDLIDKKRELAEEEKKKEKMEKIRKEFDECSEKLFCFFSSLVNAGFSDKEAIRLLQQMVANGKAT